MDDLAEVHNSCCLISAEIVAWCRASTQELGQLPEARYSLDRLSQGLDKWERLDVLHRFAHSVSAFDLKKLYQTYRGAIDVFTGASEHPQSGESRVPA